MDKIELQETNTRMCFACRSKRSREELLRFVRKSDGEVCFDEKKAISSREVWACPDKNCLKRLFLKTKLFKEPTLPVAGPAMIDFVASRLSKGALSRLGLSRKMGQLEVGRDAVLRLVKSERPLVDAIVLAQDLSFRSVEEIEKEARKYKVKCIRSPFSMDNLGDSLGREKTGVVGLLKSRITSEICQNIDFVLRMAA